MVDSTNVLENPYSEENLNVSENPDSLEVAELDLFVTLLNSWHKDRVADAEYMMKIPAGVGVSFGEEEPVTLEGDVHTGFMLGVATCLSLFNILPFTTVTEDGELLPVTTHEAPTSVQ